MKTMMMTAMVAVAMTAFGAGCSIPVGGPSDDSGRRPGTAVFADGGGGGPTDGAQARPKVDANTRYVPAQDPTERQQIVSRMWATLTAAQCWHMQGSNDNYTFSGVNDYRYAGYETTAGQVGLISVGTFGGYDMAEIQISSTQYWLGIADAQTMVMSFVHDNGKLVTNWYTAAAPGSYCL